jgi:hypothetical protein
MCTLHFVMVYVLWRCTLCDVYVLKTLCFGTRTLCHVTFTLCCSTLCSNILEVCLMGDIRNFVYENNHGIREILSNYATWNFAKFRGILANFARNTEVTEVQKTDGIPCWRNSVDILDVVHPLSGLLGASKTSLMHNLPSVTSGRGPSCPPCSGAANRLRLWYEFDEWFVG